MTHERPLSEEERLLLQHVLVNGSASAQSFAGQVAFAKATRGCDCGCPSINLIIDPRAPQSSASERIIVDLLGTLSDGADVGLFVFTDNGYLSELEVYTFGGRAEPFPLPVIQSLHPFGEEQS